MRKFLYRETCRGQLLLDCTQLIQNHDDIGIEREHWLDITIDRQSANQTPPPVMIQYGSQQSEVAAAAVRHRFEDFSRGHCFFRSAPAERSSDGALDVRRIS